jgi:hypothetical protein
MASAAYAVETIIWSLLTLLFIVLYTGILLTIRFTPRRRVTNSKLIIALLASITVVINIPRCLDLSSVYGLLGYLTMGFLQNIVTALHIIACVVFIRAIARTLYMQVCDRSSLPHAHERVGWLDAELP